MDITFKTKLKPYGEDILLPAPKVVRGTNYVTFTKDSDDENKKKEEFSDINGKVSSKKIIYRFTGEKVFVTCRTIERSEARGLFFVVPKSYFTEYQE